MPFEDTEQNKESIRDGPFFLTDFEIQIGFDPSSNFNITTNISVHLSGLLIMNRHLTLLFVPILLHS